MTNDAKTLLLHQMKLNHLINTGAGKHQHMVVLNLHLGVMRSRHTSTHQPLQDMYASFCCMAFHYVNDKAAKKKKTSEKNGICEKMRIRRKMQAIRAKVVPEIMSDCVRLILSCAFYVL